MKRTILISGGTGFIGTHLCREALRQGDRVVVLTRRKRPPQHPPFNQVQFLHWEEATEKWNGTVCSADTIINLAGESIFRPWTRRGKQEILRSRLNSTTRLVETVRNCSRKPDVFVQASAIGFYGERGNEVLDEASQPGEGFLSQVTRQWEAASHSLEPAGIRRLVIRIGLVLGEDGGILKRLRLPFRLYLGGYPGSGNQWISWIHIQDLVEAIYFLLENPTARGTFNLVSPTSIMAQQFYRTIGAVLDRPCWIRIPSGLLKRLGGSMARELILPSQRVLPNHLTKLGFPFQFSDLSAALNHLLRKE